ncbi:MAG: nicotinate-nucleotide diphosphorylase (carboxylating) [Candidatus Melainabacteria bacterium GWF2_37_15]|nr:MAG: nicotinate-nucleotide diphosphorylase (carboxylating) [Candidatus Melainabacteria bacterium GWF2_37_15]
MYSLNNPLVKDLIKQALIEDIGHGDLTTFTIIPENQTVTARYNAREQCIVAGLPVLKMIFDLLGGDVNINYLANEGDRVKAGQDIAEISGNARAILTGERLSLNFLQRMSAIATMTARYQEAIKPYKARICDTRKSCPNFRIFEKYSVSIGGGSPHRFGLYDCVMIKDNHIAAAGGIEQAVMAAKQKISHTVKIEVETQSIEEVKQALEAGADIIMFDNMSVTQMEEAVKFVNSQAITEASGTVTLENINNIASSGVDYISTSAITAKAGIIDIGLDF